MVIHTSYNCDQLIKRIGAYSHHTTTVYRLIIISILHQGCVESNISSISVPTNAITPQPTNIPTSVSAPILVIPSTTSTQIPIPTHTSSPVPAGAIAGGVVGGIVLLGAIFALVWYMVRTQKKLANTEPAVEQYNQGVDSPHNYATSPEKTVHEQHRSSHTVEGEFTPHLRYPENPPSANLSIRGNY